MSKPKMNPYKQEAPEWQIYEGIKSAEILVRTFTEDSERALSKASVARAKLQAYQEALAKLDPQVELGG